MPTSDRHGIAGVRVRPRIWSWLVGPLALAACHQQPATPKPKPKPTPTAAAIPCAVGGAPLAPRCTAELVTEFGQTRLVVRNPDGGFHRFDVTRNGTGLVATDGAANPKVTPVDADTIEVAIGGDRYRLPATVKR